MDDKMNPAVLEALVTGGAGDPFHAREFAVQYRAASGETFYRRPVHFNSFGELNEHARRDDIVTIHLGPLTMERQWLIFDLDVTDYKNVCSCNCAETRSACALCWTYIRLAMHLITRMLQHGWGFAHPHIQWFYSGNRGAHCFVTDPRVLLMDEAQRAGVAREIVRPGGPMQQRFHAEMIEFFTSNILPHHSGQITASGRDLTTPDGIAAVCWPRIDANVTKQPKHLIRCPGTRHARTGRFSVALPDNDNVLHYQPAWMVRTGPEGP